MIQTQSEKELKCLEHNEQDTHLQNRCLKCVGREMQLWVDVQEADKHLENVKRTVWNERQVLHQKNLENLQELSGQLQQLKITFNSSLDKTLPINQFIQNGMKKENNSIIELSMSHLDQFQSKNSSQQLLYIDYLELQSFYRDQIKRLKWIKVLFNWKKTQRKLNLVKKVDGFNQKYHLMPSVQVHKTVFNLLRFVTEWEVDMTYPVIEYNKFGYQAVVFGINLVYKLNNQMFLYAYNYNVITQNIRFRKFRYLFQVVQCVIFGKIYFEYKSELTKVNLFDEYVHLRAQELVKENEFLLEHEDIKRFVWWYENYKETLCGVHRQANDHASTDFKDSELILQDFIRRYANPNQSRPLNYQEKGVLF